MLVCPRSHCELDIPYKMLESRSDGMRVDVGFNPRRTVQPTAYCSTHGVLFNPRRALFEVQYE